MLLTFNQGKLIKMETIQKLPDLEYSLGGSPYITYRFSSNSTPNLFHIEGQDIFIKQMLREFEIAYYPRIRFFKLTREESTDFFGRFCSGVYINRERAIISSWWYNPHEVSHSISRLIGKPPKFISEGFALYYANKHNFKHDKNIDLKNVSVDEISVNLIKNLMNDPVFLAQPDVFTYPVAYLFFSFIEKQHGKETIRELLSLERGPSAQLALNSGRLNRYCREFVDYAHSLKHAE